MLEICDHAPPGVREKAVTPQAYDTQTVVSVLFLLSGAAVLLGSTCTAWTVTPADWVATFDHPGSSNENSGYSVWCSNAMVGYEY